MIRSKVLALVPVVGLSFALLSVSASPGHGYVSVAAAAFRPQYSGYGFINEGQRVVNTDDTMQHWSGNVQLPHGAVVTKVMFYWYDDSPSDAVLDLHRHNRTNTAYVSMATASSSGNPGDGSTEDTEIKFPVIDNTQYSYFLRTELPKTFTGLYGATIEYTYPVSLPLVVRSFQSRLGGR